MGKLVTNRVQRIYSKYTTQVVRDLSVKNDTYAVRTSKVTCPNCVLDVVTQTSSGRYKTGGPEPFDGSTCPVCNNDGKVSTEVRTKLVATVKFFKPMKDETPTGAGDLPNNTARIKALKAQLQAVKDAEWFEINGRRYVPITIEKERGLLKRESFERYVRLDE